VFVATLATTLIAAGGGAPPALAIWNTATYGSNHHYSGSTVDAVRTWTYSWRLRLYRWPCADSGDILEEYTRGGRSAITNTTYFATPSYADDVITGGDRCVRYFVYHGTVVGQNRVGNVAEATY
jgi:hypothetical protein